jgi:hypothetical protein
MDKDEKKVLMNVKIYYKGFLSKENEIGYLDLELLIRKDSYKYPNSKLIADVSNSYEIEGERDVIPVSIINVRCIVAHIIKIENIKDGYDAAVTCRYDTQKATETIKIRGINTIVQFGFSMPEEE